MYKKYDGLPSPSELREMIDDVVFLECLREAGVDNWEGYDEACRLYRERDLNQDA